MVRGFVTPFADQIVDKSRQPHIADWTSKDASERFKDLDSTLERIRSQETHLLVEVNTFDVGGAIWYRREEPPIDISPYNSTYTFAIRLYEGYTKKGLATPSMRRSLSDFMEDRRLSGELQDLGGIWLSVKKNNRDAIGLYERFGYETVGSYNDIDDRLIMVLPAERILEIFRGA